MKLYLICIKQIGLIQTQVLSEQSECHKRRKGDGNRSDPGSAVRTGGDGIRCFRRPYYRSITNSFVVSFRTTKREQPEQTEN